MPYRPACHCLGGFHRTESLLHGAKSVALLVVPAGSASGVCSCGQIPDPGRAPLSPGAHLLFPLPFVCVHPCCPTWRRCSFSEAGNAPSSSLPWFTELRAPHRRSPPRAGARHTQFCVCDRPWTTPSAALHHVWHPREPPPAVSPLWNRRCHLPVTKRPTARQAAELGPQQGPARAWLRLERR